MLRYRYVPKRSTRKEAVEEDTQGGPGQTTIRRRRQSSGTKVQMAAEAFPPPPEVAADPLSDDAGETDNSKDSGREGEIITGLWYAQVKRLDKLNDFSVQVWNSDLKGKKQAAEINIYPDYHK